MKKFCKDLKKCGMEIIMKKMIPLTKKSINHIIYYICKGEFEDTHYKIRDHCHYRGAGIYSYI